MLIYLGEFKTVLCELLICMLWEKKVNYFPPFLQLFQINQQCYWLVLTMITSLDYGTQFKLVVQRDVRFLLYPLFSSTW